MYATRSQARAIIGRRTIEQIKPIEFTWNVSNPGVGFIAQPVQSWSAFNIPQTTQPMSNSKFTFNTQQSTVLTITGDGEVIWSGKPSQAADVLVRSFQLAVEDAKGVTKAARRRYYYKACKNILNKAEKMEHDEFVDFLRKQVYNRERTVILDGLKGKE